MSGPAAFATASKGTETVLAEELRECGVARAEAMPGGVAFGETLEDAYRACLHSRIASRVVWPLSRFTADDADAFYAGVREIPWLDHLGPSSTLAVAVAGSNAPSGPPHFLTRLAKDAIVDAVREAKGSRPSVDLERPDVRIHVHVAGAATQVAIDLAGRGLHHRGLRRRAAAAPLRETLAAALLRMAGWNRETADRPLFDPMCGSGTFLLEGAAIACRVAPGLGRRGFGAARWFGHDAGLWSRLVDEAREWADAGRRRVLRVAGADASPRLVEATRRTIDRAGWSRRIRLHVRELRDVTPPWQAPGLVVVNPPYGERLGHAGELGPLYESLGDLLKQRFPGWTGWILSGNRSLDKRVGLRASSRAIVWNGPIECRWLSYPIEATETSASASARDADGTGEPGEPGETGETGETGDGTPRGPAWRKPSDAVQPFLRKLKKNFADRKRWADREGITAFRVYDSAIPEWNLSVDWYDGAVRVEEYAPPKRIPEGKAARRLQEAMRAVPEALGVAPEAVSLRVRRRRGPESQIEKMDDRGRFRVVREGDLKFRVNLTDYLDTGLFLDDRRLRARIREKARAKRFLNLFAYTCSASVAAAVGGARSTTSVDLSNAYLDWGRKNFELNGLKAAGGPHRFVRGDAIAGLKAAPDEGYDAILVAPPSYSRSKGMEGDFDVQRDHAWMLSQLVRRRLARGGTIWFTTNLRKFALDEERIREAGLVATEITEDVTPRDFRRRPRMRAWELRGERR